MYEVIVLGATFASAGIASQYKEKCLVIERRAQAGYEFFDALNYGVNYEKSPHGKEALDLQEKFRGEKSIFNCATFIYDYFKECKTLFGVQIVSIEKNDGFFTCTTYSSSGYKTFKAKKIIDTRCNQTMADLKTYNILIESKGEPSFDGVAYTKAIGENRYVLCIDVPVSCSYSEARGKALGIIKQFDEDKRIILLAGEFDYTVKSSYPKADGEILYLPSKAFDNPVLSFECGINTGKGDM